MLFLLVSLLSHVAVDCAWEKFSEWTDCSATCGCSIKTRSRTEAIQASNGGAPCTGVARETQHCQTQECPGGSKH